MATVGYDGTSGDILWALRHDGPAGESDEARDLAVSPQGDIYVTGYGYGIGSGKDHVTLRYLAAPPSGVPMAAAAAWLEPAFPNPFNPRTTIAFTLAEAGRAKRPSTGWTAAGCGSCRTVRPPPDGTPGLGRRDGAGP